MPLTVDHLRMPRLYGFSHYVMGWLWGAFFRGEVAGTENLPREGPFIIAANHVSLLDPPCVGCHVPRVMRPFARRTLWSGRVASWWLDGVGGIPVDREAGDVAAIKRVLQVLQENRGLILFPEGTRSPDGRLQKPKSGVGLMACRTGAAVVPARIFGSFEAMGKGRAFPRFCTPVSVVFGRPLHPADYDDPSAGKARYEVAAERIMARIAALTPPEYAVV
jgi:1-acyl-sn-glycerol-3-phosphate acyltransferase